MIRPLPQLQERRSMNDLQIAALPPSALIARNVLHGLAPQTLQRIDQVADKPPQTHEKPYLSLEEIWKIRRNTTILNRTTSDKKQQITQDVVRLQISRLITSNTYRILTASWLSAIEVVAAQWFDIQACAYSDELAWLYGRHLELFEMYEQEQGP